MAAPLYLTKGELRDKLLTRLGYGGLGAAAGMFVPMADDLLEEAQEQLFQVLTDENGVREWPFNTGIGQRWYDIPETCDIDQINYIAAKQSQQESDEWYELTRGIDLAHDSVYEDTEDRPYRYDIRANGDLLSGNIQTNSTLSIPDTSVNGGLAGYTWSASEWEVSGGKLRANAAFKQVYSQAPVDAGEVYEITYTIEEAPLVMNFGGTSVDQYGLALPVNVGTHTARVVATNTEGFMFLSSVSAVVVIDNLIAKKVLTEVTTQIEIWPKPDQAYPMKIEGVMTIRPFVADGDRASFDSRLVLLYAVAFGKAHLNKPDAKSAMDAWTTRLKHIKANQHGTRRYVRRNPRKPEYEVRTRPKVV